MERKSKDWVIVGLQESVLEDEGDLDWPCTRCLDEIKKACNAKSLDCMNWEQ